jgi:type VI secretion system protein ImpL
MPLTDFAEVFGHGGLYDKFFAERLDKLVDRSQRPWAWREGSVRSSPGMLAQFERVDRIRGMFFGQGGKTPEVGFIVRLSNLDPQATRFYFYVDGQSSSIKPGGELRSPMVWPGPPDKRGIAYATFEDTVAQPEQAAGFDGPWAWFRLIDLAKMPPAQPGSGAGLVSELRFQTKFHQAQVTIEAANAASNPFGTRDWRQFRCEH